MQTAHENGVLFALFYRSVRAGTSAKSAFFYCDSDKKKTTRVGINTRDLVIGRVSPQRSAAESRDHRYEKQLESRLELKSHVSYDVFSRSLRGQILPIPP